MLSKEVVELSKQHSIIRDIFEYGMKRAKEVGAENVFDFSIGNPSVPAPKEIDETALRLLKTADPVDIHGYTSNAGVLEVRENIAKSLNKRFDTNYTAANIFMTIGAAAALGICFKTLVDGPEGSYSEMFRKVSEGLSAEKMHRYDADEIIWLNNQKADDYTRECKVCKHIGKVDENGLCSLCNKIQKLSNDVLYSDFFSVVLEGEADGLPLPGGYLLLADNEKTLPKRMDKDPYFVRAYAKNKMYTGKHIATKLWVGDYTTGATFEQFAEKADGIKRIGVLRADVDNLGQTFVGGFSGKYSTLSRTAALSRQLSIFFKYYIRLILKNGECHIAGSKELKERNATIVYSGGDDVFIVGAWNEIIELAVDLEEKFRKYTKICTSIHDS